MPPATTWPSQKQEGTPLLAGGRSYISAVAALRARHYLQFVAWTSARLHADLGEPGVGRRVPHTPASWTGGDVELESRQKDTSAAKREGRCKGKQQSDRRGCCLCWSLASSSPLAYHLLHKKCQELRNCPCIVACEGKSHASVLSS